MIELTRAIALAGAVVAAAVLALGATAASGKAKTATVEVDDDFFSPTFLKVKQNTKVEWNWIGDDVHDVTKGSGPGKFFESGPLEGSGVLYSKRFKKAGRYKIICTLHEEMRMELKVKRKKRK